MASDSSISNENIYYRCRKDAAKQNSHVNSRFDAAELLGISDSTLGNYERGITKQMPVDIVVKMAELYNAPELKNHYCKHDCPIGKDQPIASEITNIEKVAVRLIDTLDKKGYKHFRQSILAVATNGIETEADKKVFLALLKRVDELMVILSELRMLGEKKLKGC